MPPTSRAVPTSSIVAVADSGEYAITRSPRLLRCRDCSEAPPVIVPVHVRFALGSMVQFVLFFGFVPTKMYAVALLASARSAVAPAPVVSAFTPSPALLEPRTPASSACPVENPATPSPFEDDPITPVANPAVPRLMPRTPAFPLTERVRPSTPSPAEKPKTPLVSSPVEWPSTHALPAWQLKTVLLPVSSRCARTMPKLETATAAPTAIVPSRVNFCLDENEDIVSSLRFPSKPLTPFPLARGCTV